MGERKGWKIKGYSDEKVFKFEVCCFRNLFMHATYATQLGGGYMGNHREFGHAAS